MGYEWLPWALATLTGIEPDEVMQVLAGNRRLPAAATSGVVPIVTISGRTWAGRPLIVAVRKIGDFDQQIIGVREMTPAELATFENWEATA
ncbi:MAG TPA: hypothetical protein VFO77_02290 [Actinoplanes sp.]|nr:hypothetical protein [Actinoplanes sp.]